MKTLFRILGITLLVLLIAAIVLPMVFKKEITQIAVTEINKSVNAEVSLGEINLSLLRNFPNFTLSIEELKVRGEGEFADVDLLKLDEALVIINLGSVISKKGYEVKRILLKNTYADVRILESGAANFDVAPASEEEIEVGDENTEDAPFNLSLKSFEIENFNLSFTDDSSKLHTSINDLNFNLSGDLGNKSTVVKTTTSIEAFNFSQDGVHLVKNAKLNYDASFDADLENSVFKLKNNKLSINEILLSLDGSVTLLEEGMNLNLTFGSGETSFKSLLSMIPAVYMTDFEELSAEGTLKIEGFAKGNLQGDIIPAFSLKMAVNDGYFKYPELPSSIDKVKIETIVKNKGGDIDNTIVEVPTFMMMIADNPIYATFHLDHPISDPHFLGSLNADLDFRNLKKVYPLEEDIRGELVSNVKFEGVLSDIEKEQFDKIDAFGSIVLNNVAYVSDSLPYAVEVPKAQLNFSPAYLDLPVFKLRLGSNDINASGKITNYLGYALGDETLKGNLAIQSDKLNLNELIPASEEQIDSIPEDTVQLSVVEVPERIDFTLTTSIKNIIYENYNLDNVRGKVFIKDQAIVLEDISSGILGGTAKINGSYTTKDGIPETDFAMDVKNIGIPDAYNTFAVVQQYLPVAKNSTGDFSTAFGLKTQLTESMMPNFATLNGAGSFNSNQINLKDLKIYDELAKVLNKPKSGDFKINDANIDFEFTDGQLKVKPFKVFIDGMPASISGYTTLEKNVRYEIDMNVPFSKLGKQANTFVNDLAGNWGVGNVSNLTIPVNLLVEGTLTKPKVTTNYKKGVKGSGSTQGTVKTVAKEAVKSKVNDEAAKQLAEVEAKAEALLAQAEKQAEQIKSEARGKAEMLKKDARTEADKLVAEAEKKNAFAGIAAKATAKKLLEKSDSKADDLVTKADAEADKLVSEAKVKAEKMKADARKKTAIK